MKISTTAIQADLSATRPTASASSRDSSSPDSAPSDSSALFERRHDLDALRATAMLLGIVLHTALSFTSIPWAVQDSQQSDFYHVVFACIHGFRMPLFFMLSGFFTAMLWRKRGLVSLVKHRVKRIFLPLVLGCLTIVPTMWIVGYIVTRPSANQSGNATIGEAVVSGDVDRLREALEASAVGPNSLDPNSGSSPLSTAVFLGNSEMVDVLISAKADVNLRNRDNATPLHVAAFMGRAKEAALLQKAGADPNARNGSGQTPADLLQTDFGTTNFIASQFGIQLDEETLLVGRADIAKLLGATDYLGSDSDLGDSRRLESLFGLLFQLPVFMHLWFLWFLCWLLVAFLLYTLIARTLHIESLPGWIICSPISLAWLIPLTMVPQSFMGAATFGPDPSIGLLPIPSVFAYYAIFFFFGAVYWDMEDRSGRFGGWWYVSLPVALFVVFPVGFDFVTGTFGMIPRPVDRASHDLLGNLLQATFAWLMVSGSVGLCRRFLSQENETLRYISDSSYWLYLIHLPLVILAQWLVRDLTLPSFLKFTGITVVISALLLISYEFGVRYTLIGRLLNGPRTRGA